MVYERKHVPLYPEFRDELELYITEKIDFEKLHEHWKLSSNQQLEMTKNLNNLHHKMVQETGNLIWFQSMPNVTWTSLVNFYTSNSKNEFLLVEGDLNVWTQLGCPIDTSSILRFAQGHRKGLLSRSSVWLQKGNAQLKADAPRESDWLQVFLAHPDHTFVGKLALWWLCVYSRNRCE